MIGWRKRSVGVDAAAGQGVQVGDHNTQVNVFAPYIDQRKAEAAAAEAKPVVVGDVPQEPAAFQPRHGLMEALEGTGGSRVSVVYAVTGIRGTGKTQVAAAYARRRITDGWRLVAWVDASDEASVLSGLERVAKAAGVGAAGEDARVLAAGVRHWLEADGERRLLVFDNAVDLDVLRPFLPAGGAAHVIVTSSRQSAAGLGRPVPVDVFSEGEAVAFLAERTGLDDAAGARELAEELGFLPLGLAQAAALIARERLVYGTYLGRLRTQRIAQYLRRAEGDAYPYRLAEVIILSLRAAEAHDGSARRARLMRLVAVLAETGVSRRVLHLAASARVLGRGRLGAAEVDAALGELVDASLLGFTVDDSVVAHRLVMRVTRERMAAEGRLFGVLCDAARVLEGLAGGIAAGWRDPAAVLELAMQVSTIVAHLASHPNAFVGKMLDTRLLPLRHRSVELLNELGDSTGLAIFAAEQLVADCERMLGADHPNTLISRTTLALAYQAAGRTTEAIPLLEQTLADFERVLGADQGHALLSRSNLALAYLAVGRTTEAISLLEQTLAEWGEVPGDPYSATVRTNLARAYQAAGRTAEAILLLEQTLTDCERALGADHATTLGSRDGLAMAYHAAGRIAEAIPLSERALADFERMLGAEHPTTLGSRTHLAMAYQAAGRTTEAISLLVQTLADCERVMGADHPDTNLVREDLAALIGDNGK